MILQVTWIEFELVSNTLNEIGLNSNSMEQKMMQMVHKKLKKMCSSLQSSMTRCLKFKKKKLWWKKEKEEKKKHLSISKVNSKPKSSLAALLKPNLCTPPIPTPMVTLLLE